MLRNKKFFFLSVVFSLLLLLSSGSILSKGSQCFQELSTKQSSRDDDFDGYPDFLEEALGYSATEDDCMAQMKCGDVDGDLMRLGENKNILIILDASGSMGSRTREGKSRMQAAKESITQYIQNLPENTNVGLMVYSAQQIRGKSCERVEMFQEIGPLNKNAMVTKIQNIKEKGLTPMALSLEKAREILEKKKNDDNHLIFISDGRETCKGNPIESIYKLKKSPAKPVIHVIGFGVKGRAKRQLQCMAQVAGAKYHDVKSGADLAKALQTSYHQLNQFYKVMVCIHREFNKYRACENSKYNKANAWLIRNKLMEKDAEKRKAMEDAEKSIKFRYFTYVKNLSSQSFEKKTKKLRSDIDSLSKGMR